MEETVLREIEEKLPLITEIRIEFHFNSTNEANNFERMLLLLSKYNFKYAFELDRRVIGIDELKRGMKHADPFQFIIYAHRNWRRVRWQSWFVPKLIRIQNMMGRKI